MKIKTKFQIIINLIFIFTIFSNCSSDKEILDNNNKTDIKIYKDATKLIERRKFDEATLEFDNLNLNYPYSSLASKAEVMSAYALYQNNEIKKAVKKLEFFIEMNPSGQLSEYSHYLLAMCYYIQISNQGRDPNLSKKALNYFKRILTKFPDSKYAKDAKLKIQYIRNALARNELLIGIFYLNNNSPSSSIKRFKSIIQNYQNTEVIPETLYRLSEALLMVGLKQEAIKSNALLNYNFPNNKWSELSKELIKKKKNLSDEEKSSSFKNYLKTIFD